MNTEIALDPPTIRDRARNALAITLALLLTVAGAITASPAHALVDGAVITGTVTGAAESGLTLQVEASGLGEPTQAYAALIEKGTESAISGAGGYAAFAQPFPVITAGATSFALSAPTAALDRNKVYEVLIWQVHSPANAETIYARSDVAISSGQWDAVFPPAPTDPEPTDPEPTDPEPTDPEPTDPEPATPVVTVSKSVGVDPAGEVVTVSGSGFVAASGPVGARPPLAGQPSGVYVAFGKFADTWKPSEGAGAGARPTQSVVWALPQPSFSALNPSGTNPAYALVQADGTFEVEVPVADASAAASGNYGVYTYPGGGAVFPAYETFTPVAFADPVPVGPRLDVTVTDVSATSGATIRVVGSDLGTATGAYAAVIEKGTESAVTGSGGYVVFALPFPAIANGATDFTVIAPASKLERGKEYEVLVWQQHTAPDSTTIHARADVPLTTADWDVLAPLDVPRVTVSKSTGIAPGGETITVRGTGFVADPPGTNGTRPPLFGQFAGAYVVFGSFLDDWRPSEHAPSSARKAYDTKWGVHASSVDLIGGPDRGAIVIQPDGTFETTLTAAQAADALAGGNWGVYTFAGGGAVHAPFETFTAVTFASDPTPPTPPVTTPPTTTTPVAGGSLRWAISTSFSNYVTGDIAHGSIAVSGGATRGNGLFQFGQSSSTYRAATGTGTVSYSGAVRFTGHAGALDVTIANPQVRITSPSSASLYVTSGGTRVDFATLSLAAGTRTTSGGAITFAGVPATLTAAGRNQVFQGNSTTLDPVTFTIGSTAAAPLGSTGTVASAAPAAPPRTIPATPPATSGIDLDAETLEALESGRQVTISVAGFQSNEQDIAVVVYSEPVLLGTVDADASGTATWTGTLPATLADGEHTLTFQGSVDRGIRFALARAATALDGCVVEGASLQWGFKESFRNYIEGIAKGGWELTGVVYEFPEYVWTSGTGTADAEARTGLVTYGGSIRFTGHDGALDTTIANARVEIAGDTGYLVFDVSGTTQAGEPVEQSGVRLAEFALPDLEVTEDGLVLDALPATLTDAGSAAFGTYPAGEALDPVSAVLPVDADCGVVVVAAPAEDVPVAEATDVDAIAAEPAAAPIWPWAVGGIALALGIGAVVWIVLSRRRATAGGNGETDAG